MPDSNTLQRCGRIAGDGVLDAIGQTPLVRLRRLVHERDIAVWAKLEALNPGGSGKDRNAAYVLDAALVAGDLRPGYTVVESTSGNFGVGLAQACRYHGLKLICVVDVRTTAANLDLLRAYGAQIELVDPDGPWGTDLLLGRRQRVRELLGEIRGSFCPNQYENLMGAEAQQETMRELVDQLGHSPDYLFCAAGTCATLRGCADYIQLIGADTRVIAVDALGSVIFDGPPGVRLLPGHGSSIRPALLEPSNIDIVLYIGERDAIAGCRRLLQREAILAGASSGALVAALRRMLDALPDECSVALVFPDRGERYLDTVYSDDWVREHYGSRAVREVTEP
jgi:2,3-diaminopropionate biosynthesis protein SbnA